MFTAAMRSGERPGLAGWSGLALAVARLVVLVVLGEPITAKVLLASLLILGGVLIGVLRPHGRVRAHPPSPEVETHVEGASR